MRTHVKLNQTVINYPYSPLYHLKTCLSRPRTNENNNYG